MRALIVATELDVVKSSKVLIMMLAYIVWWIKALIGGCNFMVDIFKFLLSTFGGFLWVSRNENFCILFRKQLFSSQLVTT